MVSGRRGDGDHTHQQVSSIGVSLDLIQNATKDYPPNFYTYLGERKALIQKKTAHLTIYATARR